MTKKIFNFILLILLVLPVVILTGCFFSGNNNEKVINGKVNLASSKVRIEILGSYYYTGEPLEVHSSNLRIYIDDSGSYLNPAQLNLSYVNNIEVGTADLIITAKEESRYVYGTVTTHFEIEPNYKQGDATSFEEAKTMLAGNYYKYVRITEDIEIPQGETLVIPAEKSLRFVNSWAEYKNYGTITISEGALVSVGNGAENWFFNFGTINVNGTLTLVGRCYVFDSGRINGEIDATSSAKIYTNSQVSVSDTTPASIVTVRKALTDASVSVELDVDQNNSCKFVENVGGKPSFIVDGNSVSYTNENQESAYLRPSYTGADSLGSATATLVASYDNKQYFGEITKNYNIIKGQVACDSEQELYDFQASGFYDEYVLKYGISIKNDFTLQQDEILWVDQNAFYSTFNNYGTIKPVNNCTISIEGHGTFNNYGSVIPTDTATISFGFSGVLNNGSAQQTALLDLANMTIYDFPAAEYYGRFNNYSDVQISGSLKVGQDNNHIQCVLTNYGNIIATGTQTSYYTQNAIYGYGTVNNYGDIDGFKLNVYENGLFENFGGSSVVTTYTDLMNGSRIINNSGATFTFGKTSENTTKIERINIVNNGMIVNKSVMDIKNNYIFQNAGTFDNSVGHVWAFSQPTGNEIEENITIIKRLNQSEIVLLGIDDAMYDGSTSFIPTGFTVDGETLKKGDYSVIMQYVGDTNDSTYRKAGFVKYSISITNFHNDSTTHTYGGDASVTYKIEYGETIANNSNFIDKIQNRNWGKITLTEDVLYDQYNFIIKSHQTVDTNGHALSIKTEYSSWYDINYTFTNEGNIILRQVGTGVVSYDNCALKVYGTKVGEKIYNSTFVNKGTIENHSIIYVSEEGGIFQNNLGTITGDGVIYTWSGGVFNSIGSNTLYARKALAAENIELSQDVFDYNLGAQIQPTVNAIKDGSYIATLSDYKIEYQDNVDAGIAKVIVTPNDRFDQHFIKGERTFTINRIVGILNDSTIYNLDGNNYYKYNLAYNITLEDNVEFPDNVIFDYGDYRITTGNYRISIGGADTQIWVNVNSSNVDKFTSVRDFADKITFTSDVSINSLYLFYSGNYNGSDYLHMHVDSLTIDLNGHTINGFFNTHFTSSHDMYLNIIDSSPSHSGVIRNTEHPIVYTYVSDPYYNAHEYYSISIADASSQSAGVNIYVNLENVTVYGMAVYNMVNAAHAQITANNCNFYKPSKIVENYTYVRSIIHANNDNSTITLNGCYVEE